MTKNTTANGVPAGGARNLILVCAPGLAKPPAGLSPMSDDNLRILIDPRGISRTMLAAMRPVRIITTLTVAGTDALQLAQQLNAAGYEGELFVLVPPLPRPDMVLAEIRAAAPRMRIDMIDPHDRSLTLAPQPL